MQKKIISLIIITIIKIIIKKTLNQKKFLIIAIITFLKTTKILKKILIKLIFSNNQNYKIIKIIKATKIFYNNNYKKNKNQMIIYSHSKKIKNNPKN